jgi:hypothetical protein
VGVCAGVCVLITKQPSNFVSFFVLEQIRPTHRA